MRSGFETWPGHCVVFLVCRSGLRNTSKIIKQDEIVALLSHYDLRWQKLSVCAYVITLMEDIFLLLPG